MLQIDKAVLSLDLFEEKFVCDLAKCKGACCIEGDSGAPLAIGEAEKIRENLPNILPYLSEKSKATIEKYGIAVLDEDGDLVTVLNDHKECAFVIWDKDKIAGCSIEKAWKDKKSNFRKPISCHLYPIRIQSYTEFDAVNYHRWDICKPAVELGNKANVSIVQFLKEALQRKYGEEFGKQIDETQAHIDSSNT